MIQYLCWPHLHECIWYLIAKPCSLIWSWPMELWKAFQNFGVCLWNLFSFNYFHRFLIGLMSGLCADHWSFSRLQTTIIYSYAVALTLSFIIDQGAEPKPWKTALDHYSSFTKCYCWHKSKAWFITPENTFPLFHSSVVTCFTPLQSTFGIAHSDLRFVWGCSAMKTYFINLSMHGSWADVAFGGSFGTSKSYKAE